MTRETTFERRRRWTATALTWAVKTAALLRFQAGEAGNESERWLIGYDAERTFAAFVDAADSLVSVLNDEDVEGAEERARALADRLRDLRRARALNRVEGRTPEEAAAFKAKAAELRARSGAPW